MFSFFIEGSERIHDEKECIQSSEYEHLVTITKSDGRCCYQIAPGFGIDELSGEERFLLNKSR